MTILEVLNSTAPQCKFVHLCMPCGSATLIGYEAMTSSIMTTISIIIGKIPGYLGPWRSFFVMQEDLHEMLRPYQ